MDKFAKGSLSSRVKSLSIGAALLAVIVPMNAFAFDINGPTAESWVTAGALEDIVVTLHAIPANEAAYEYIGPVGPSYMLDATERDNHPVSSVFASPPFGLGVGNTLISLGMPGVTSQPWEIGFYGNAAICGPGMVLGENCADEFGVVLDTAVQGGHAATTFFYGSSEQDGESLQVYLYNDGVLVDSSTQASDVSGVYGQGDPGYYAFDLPADLCWDEIRFIGDYSNVNDAADFLVEGIYDLVLCETEEPETQPELSYSQGFYGNSPEGEAMVAGLINEDNCEEIAAILASIGKGSFECPDDGTMAFFLTGTVGPGKEKGANIGFLPAGTKLGDNLATQKITVLLNMQLPLGIGASNVLNIDPVTVLGFDLDPILTTGGYLGTCNDLFPVDGMCDAGTVVLTPLGEIVSALDLAGTTVGDALMAADAYIAAYGLAIKPGDPITINGVDLTAGNLVSILGLINTSYDNGMPTGFVTLGDDPNGELPVCGDCLTSGHGVGCEVSECEAAVCVDDDFCCWGAWDGFCVDEAVNLCLGVSCQLDLPLCPDCLTGPGPGCEVSECQAAVCEVDPFCCDTAWDSFCVYEAGSLCQLSPCQ